VGTAHRGAKTVGGAHPTANPAAPAGGTGPPAGAVSVRRAVRRVRLTGRTSRRLDGPRPVPNNDW